LATSGFIITPKLGVCEAGSSSSGVKAVWDAIKAVRAAHPHPAEALGGRAPKPGKLDAGALA
jgi:hypothetical protein